MISYEGLRPIVRGGTVESREKEATILEKTSGDFFVQPVTGVPPVGSLLLGTFGARGTRGTELFSPYIIPKIG